MKTRFENGFAALALTLALCLPQSASAQSYTFSTFDPPGSTQTQARGVNNAGAVVGMFDDANGRHGFLFQGGTFTTINVPGAVATLANGINDGGQIVGVYIDANSKIRGFLLSGGQFTSFDFPGATLTQGWGINNSGQIVGSYEDGVTSHGFLLSGGVYTTIDVPGSNFAQSTKINSSGQIVGFHYDTTANPVVVRGFVLTNGLFNIIEAPVPGAGTYADGLNDSGEVTGYYDTTGFSNHGFLLRGAQFSVIDFPGATRSLATANNNIGQIVGTYDSGGDVLHGFVATPTTPPAMYSVCLLYDPTKAVKSGATMPIKLQACDANRNNVSSASLLVHAKSVSLTNAVTNDLVQDAGNANPDSDFRYDTTLGTTGGYIFNLSTKGLSTGTYRLSFTIGVDTTIYTAAFQVK